MEEQTWNYSGEFLKRAKIIISDKQILLENRELSFMRFLCKSFIKMLCTFQQIQPITLHFIDKPGKFKVSSPEHPNYQEEKQERKTFPCPVHLLIVPLQH